MDDNTRNRITGWAITLLVLLNLILLGTIWFPRFFQAKEKNSVEPPSNGQILPPPPDPGHRKEREDRIFSYLQKELNFSDRQLSLFKTLRNHHFNITKNINRSIHDYRRQLMEQVVSDAPEKQKANELASRIGEKHRELEFQTFSHFTQLMEVCSEDQKKEFKAMFREVMRQLRPHNQHPPSQTEDRNNATAFGPRQAEPDSLPPDKHSQGTRNDHPVPPGSSGGIDAMAEQRARHMAHELELTKLQATRIEVILKKMIAKKEALRQSRKIRRLRRDAHIALEQEEDRLIEAELTQKQIEKYRQFKRNRPQLLDKPPQGR